MINKCYPSTINAQNDLKTPIKITFYITMKFVDNISLFKQKKVYKVKLFIFQRKNH